MDEGPGTTDKLVADQSATPVWFRVGDAATRLGVVPKTVYRLIDKGELTGYRIGRVIRIKESDLLAYEASCKIQPGDLAHLAEG